MQGYQPKFGKIRIDAPLVIGITVLLAGLLNVFASITIYHHQVGAFREYFPVEIRRASRTLTVLTGFFLIILARGIFQRKRRAWYVTLVISALSLALTLVRGFDFEEIIGLVIIIAGLLMFRHAFTARSARQELVQRLKTALKIFALLLAYSILGYFLFQGQFSKEVTWGNIIKDYNYTIFGVGEDTLVAQTRRARMFEDSIAFVGWASLAAVFVIIFGPQGPKHEPTEEDLEKIRRLVLGAGSNPLSYLFLMDDKMLFLSDDKQNLMAYKVRSGVAVALCGPVGNPVNRADFTKTFIAYMREHGLPVVFYQVPQPDLAPLEALGYKHIKIGEDAEIDLKNFSLEGPSIKSVRNSVAAVKRQLVSYKFYRMDELPWQMMHGIQKLYKDWVNDKQTQAMTFSLGFFPFPPENQAWVMTGQDSKGSLIGAFSFFPYNQGKNWNLDLMLRSKISPNGFVEASLAEAALFFKTQGAERLNLGLATGSYTQNAGNEASATQKAVEFLYDNLGRFYNYRSLAKFKEKFQPGWQPRYLAYPNETVLPKTVIALARVHLSKGQTK